MSFLTISLGVFGAARCPKEPQEAHNRHLRVFRGHPRGTQERPRGSHEVSRRSQEAPTRAQEAFQRAQKVPQSHPRGPKRAEKGPPETTNSPRRPMPSNSSKNCRKTRPHSPSTLLIRSCQKVFCTRSNPNGWRRWSREALFNKVAELRPPAPGGV